MPQTRRKFIVSLTSLVATHSILRGAPDATEAPGRSFRFIVINDLHHAAPECDPFFEKLIAQMKSHGPVAFCLIVGDLADTGTRASLESVKRIFGGLGTPIHTVPGNHDCDGSLDTRLYAEIFPGQLNQHFDHGGWQFIGLDSTDGRHWEKTHISDATLRYIDDVRPSLDPTAPTVVFTHFPLGEGVRMRPLNADELLARFDGLNVRACFSGHYHANTQRSWHAATVETHVCCSRVRANHDGTKAEGYRLCTAHADGTLDEAFVEFVPASESPPMPA